MPRRRTTLGQLLMREQQLVSALEKQRLRIDRELLRARSSGASYKELAFEAMATVGAEQTADELERVVVALRTRMKVAARRHVRAARVREVGKRMRSAQSCGGKEHVMVNPYRRRIIDEWFDPVPGACEVPSLDDSPESNELDGVDEHDHDLHGSDEKK